MPEANISGFQELDAAFQELAYVAQRAVLVKAVRAGSEPIVSGAVANAPSDSGNLKSQITTQLMNSQNSVDEVVVRIGPTRKAYYGSYTDRGTKFIHAIHWMTRAFQQNIQAATDRIAEVLKVQIAKATKK